MHIDKKIISREEIEKVFFGGSVDKKYQPQRGGIYISDRKLLKRSIKRGGLFNFKSILSPIKSLTKIIPRKTKITPKIIPGLKKHLKKNISNVTKIAKQKIIPQTKEYIKNKVIPEAKKKGEQILNKKVIPKVQKKIKEIKHDPTKLLKPQQVINDISNDIKQEVKNTKNTMINKGKELLNVGKKQLMNKVIDNDYIKNKVKKYIKEKTSKKIPDKMVQDVINRGIDKAVDKTFKKIYQKIGIQSGEGWGQFLYKRIDDALAKTTKGNINTWINRLKPFIKTGKGVPTKGWNRTNERDIYNFIEEPIAYKKKRPKIKL